MIGKDAVEASFFVEKADTLKEKSYPSIAINNYMKVRRSYKDEAEKLAKAIDIAIESYKKKKPFNLTENQLNGIIEGQRRHKDMALNPEPQFKSLVSLKYITEAVFTPFQEGVGETVDYFWKRIEEEKLDYKRENKLEKILGRGKIKGRIEFEYIVDMLVILQQEELISEEEAQRLNQMIGEYENKSK